MEPVQTGLPSGLAPAAAIGWLYLVTNSARVISYVPQIVAIWRCHDNAKAVSLLTWGYWMFSHFTAVLYGVMVVRDPFFVTISLTNLLCCTTVTALAARRRGLLRVN